MANYEVLEPGGHAALVDGLKDYADREGGTDTEQLADGSVEMDKLGDDVLDELDSKAYADGYYAQLTAGAADNLTGRGDGVDAEYIYRTAGGSADIADGTATVKAIKGRTLGWNQLVDASTSSLTVPSGHKYLARISGTASIATSNGSAIAVTGGTDNLFDLTQMFGAGNEPSTVAEFEALYPLPYYAYEPGDLLPVRMTGVETTGFNQLPSLTMGDINTTTGAATTDTAGTRWISDYFDAFPETDYYLKLPDGFNSSSAAYRMFCYDGSKSFIGYVEGSGIKKSLAGTRYIRMWLYVNVAQTSAPAGACINLSWSGYRNGEYEAYWSEQRIISAIAENFPDGIRSAGTVCDELTDTEAVTRVGAVDLGTLTWTVTATGSTDQYRMVSNGLRALIAKPASSAVLGDMKCSKYETLTGSAVYQLNTGISVASDGGLVVYDPSYATADSADAFKAAMSGVMLHYALATPTTTTFDQPLNMSYKVSDFGTERVMVPSGSMSAPVPMSIVYGLNAVDFIRRAPTEYVSHDSHENFVDALEAEMGVTVTETFDDTDNAYEYSIVPTDGMTIKQAKENLRGLLDLVQGTIGSVTDWSEIAEMASHGSSFLVGTQFQTTYKSAADGTEYEMPWDVMHFETATVKGGSSVAGVYLESHYALPFATMFDQIEAFYAVPSGGLAAGTYSITFGNTSAWGQVPANSTYSFTLANSYSQGAQLCFNRSIYSYAPDTCTVQAFATQGATTASETVTVSAGSAGTSLGTIGTEQVTDSSDLNHLHHIGLGSNRWMTSALRQWLNTDADGGTWWVPQTKWDRPPSYASYDGFLKGLDPDLVSAMREVRVVTAQSYSADGGTAAAPVTDVTYDKVFLLSWEQQYLAVSQSYGGTAGLEGSAWDYWKLAAGTANPRPASTSGNESTYTTAYVRYGMENHATARNSWLRSAGRRYGSDAAYVYSSGKCGGSNASYGNFAAPACFIG